ncbi:MAG TPA: hypothetical protein VJ952_10595 [Opitutales bacterium]|nr:hypothetical protein [Opitutales bacterium]
MLLSLSPLAASIEGQCVCEHTGVESSTLSPVPCCETLPQKCCYGRSGTSLPVQAPLIEASGQPRLPQPAVCELLSALPAIERVAPKLVFAPRSERPPGGRCQELSFRQSWLI